MYISTLSHSTHMHYIRLAYLSCSSTENQLSSAVKKPKGPFLFHTKLMRIKIVKIKQRFTSYFTYILYSFKNNDLFQSDYLHRILNLQLADIDIIHLSVENDIHNYVLTKQLAF